MQTSAGTDHRVRSFLINVQSLQHHQEAIRALFRVMNRYVANLPPVPGVFPDYPTPVVVAV
jgi:hypothetical protein